MGGGWSSDNRTFQIVYDQTSNQLSCVYGNNKVRISSDYNVHIIELNNKYIKIDDYLAEQTSAINDQRSVYFFARRSDNLGNGIQQYSMSRIYYCKIYDNNTLVRDYIPVLNKNKI